MKGFLEFKGQSARLDYDRERGEFVAKAEPHSFVVRKCATDVEAIAKSRDIGEREIKLGMVATEGAVRQYKLDDYRVVYFAAYGLVAGDLQGFTKAKAEPPLAFTIPEKLWQRQCEVVQRFGRNRFEVGFTTEEGNEALVAAGLPTLDSEQMGRALSQPSSLRPQPA